MTKEIPIPRFKGNAIQVGKQWGFEIYLFIGPCDPIVLTHDKPESLLLTKEAAIAKMKSMIPDLAKLVCETMGLPEPTAFQDLNTNTMKHIDAYKNAVAEKL